MGERSKFSQLPGDFSVSLPIDGNSAGADLEQPIFRNGFGSALKLTGVRFITKAAITGHASNYMTLSVQNKGTDGTGTDEAASKAYDTPTDDDLAAFESGSLTLSSTAADLVVDEGEVLSLKKVETGTGMDLAGAVELSFEFSG